MANNQNLKPFNQLTPEEHRELSRRGGQASGAARRAKKARYEKVLMERRAEDECIKMGIGLLKQINQLEKKRGIAPWL